MRNSVFHLLMLLPIVACAYPFHSLLYTIEDLTTYAFALAAVFPYMCFYILWCKNHGIEAIFQGTMAIAMSIITFIFYAPHEGFLVPFLIIIQLGVFCLALPIYLWFKKKQVSVKYT